MVCLGNVTNREVGMDPTDDQLRELFGYGDDELPPGILIIDVATGAHTFLREGVQFLDDVPVMVCFDHPERRPDETVIRYLGGLLGPRDYRLDQIVRERFLLSSAQPAYSKPPRYLGRTIPVRHQPIRGTKLTHGGWR
jgi:hypothetical protein